MMTVQDAEALVCEVRRRADPREHFIATRYPYTYAYDYYRQAHWNHAHLSRGDVAALLRGNPDKEQIVRVLADAYLADNDVLGGPEETDR